MPFCACFSTDYPIFYNWGYCDNPALGIVFTSQ